MTIKTFSRTGLTDVRELMRSVVKDLIGQGIADGDSEPTGTQFMRLVYPTDFDPTVSIEDTSFMLMLESTTAIDPFADDDATGLTDYDPWRIVLHTSQWTGRSMSEIPTSPAGGQTWVQTADPANINSLAIYVGTPSTLAMVDDLPALGWTATPLGQAYKKPIYYRKGVTSPGWAAGYEGGSGAWLDWQFKDTYNGRDLIEPIGNTGAQWTNTFDPQPNSAKFKTRPDAATYATAYTSPQRWDGPDVTDSDQLFINRYATFGPKVGSFGGFAGDIKYATQLSYRLVVSDHGLFLGCWGPDPEENGSGFSWILVQRPVDKRTGIVRGVNPLTGLPFTNTDENLPENGIGNRPLFCVNSVNGKYWKFVVREHDLDIPQARKDATLNTEDSGAVINPYQQQSLTENGEYVITFLNNFNSSRFKYSDELDMVGTVSSDVVGGGSEIDVTVYREAEPRTYHALWSSGSFGTKMRIMVVREIRAPNTPTPVAGAGAEFTISIAEGSYSIDAISLPGEAYSATQTILVLGTSLGGETPTNDAVITVISVDENGGITEASITGTSTGEGTFTNVTGTAQSL